MKRKLLLQLILVAALQGIWANNATIEHCNNSTDIESAVLRLTIALANDGHTNEANTELQILPNYATHISTVVSQVYRENVTNTERTLDILHAISCTVHAKAARVMLQEMQKSENVTKPEFLLMTPILLDPRCNGDKQIKEIRGLLVPSVNSSLDQWTDDIRNGSYDHIYQFMKSHSNKFYNVLPQVPNLVKRALAGNTTYFDSTLSFVKDIPLPDYAAQGYQTIVEELKEMGKEYSEQMLLTAYWIHNDATKRSVETIANDTSLKTSYDLLKKMIPSSFYDIFWRPKCTIKSLNLNEYLDSNLNPKNDYGYPVFTSGQRWSFDWLFEQQVVGSEVALIMKREYMTGYVVCQATDNGTVSNCGGPRSRLYNKWILRPSTLGDEKAFLLQNAHHNSQDEGYLRVEGFHPGE